MSEQQIKIDTLRGELREEKEVVGALEESKRDAERILGKKIDELLQRTAQRDQLRKQVEKLLGAIDAHRETAPSIWADQQLDKAAYEVRKELEGR